MKTTILGITAAAALALGTFIPAQAQQQEGLVNVNVSGVTVQVPVGIAANVCVESANVLAEQKESGDASCTADAASAADSRQFMNFVERQDPAAAQAIRDAAEG